MKYVAIASTRLMGSLMYERDVLVQSIFMLVVLVTFVQLWTTTYAATNQSIVGGFGLRELVWYLVITEVIGLSAPASRRRSTLRSGPVTSPTRWPGRTTTRSITWPASGARPCCGRR